MGLYLRHLVSCPCLLQILGLSLLSMLILQPFRHFTYVTAHYPTLPTLYLHHSSSAHSPTIPSLHLRHSSFSNPSDALPTSQLICSFSNHSVTSPTSQLILQPLFRFSYVTGSSHTSPGELPMSATNSWIVTVIHAHSPTIPSLHLSHSSFSNPSFASSTSLGLYLRHLVSCPCLLKNPWIVTVIHAYSPTIPSLHLRHSSFSNPSFAFPTSLGLYLRHLVSCPCLIQILGSSLSSMLIL